MADIATTAVADADPLAREFDNTARERFYRELEARLVGGGWPATEFRSLAARMVELQKAFREAPRGTVEENDAALDIIEDVAKAAEAWLRCPAPDAEAIKFKMRSLIAEAQEGCTAEVHHLVPVQLDMERILAQPSPLPRKDTFELEIMAERACVVLWCIIETDLLGHHDSVPEATVRAGSGDALTLIMSAFEDLQRATGWRAA
jgi:hypothetical protein